MQNRQARLRRVAVAALAVAVSPAPSAALAAGDLLVTGTTPNQVVVVDADAGKVVQRIAIPGTGNPATMAVDARDDSRIYVLTNQWSSVCVVSRKSGTTEKCVDLASFAPPKAPEMVRGTGLDVNPKKNELYVYEMPVRILPGRYEVQKTRIRVLDSRTLESLRTFEAPRQGLVVASSPDGSKIYSFHVGDIHEWDPATGKMLRTIPFVNHNISGMGLVDGLPFYPNYSENGHVVAFGYGAEDPFNATFLTGFAHFDLKTGKLDMFEIGPFGVEQYYLGAVLSPQLGRGYLCWNYLTMVDVKKRKILKTVEMDTTRFYPTVSTDLKKLYVPTGSGSTVGVFDANDLRLLKVIELGNNIAAGTLRVVRGK